MTYDVTYKVYLCLYHFFLFTCVCVISVGKCHWNLRSSCKGKEGYTSLAYEATVDHNKRVHHLAGHHYGAKNDKTIVMTDSHVQAIRDGELYQDLEYEMFVNEDGTMETFVGGYLIADGGYHRWRCLQCPLKHSEDPDVNLFCAALESIRKDVECFFGILKIRFRYIDGKIEVHSFEEIDNVMYVCCILHNMLLEHDGFSDRWRDLDEWADPDADAHEVFDGQEHLDIIEARGVARAGGQLTVGMLRAVADIDEYDVEHDPTWGNLHNALVKNYRIAKQRNALQWLK